MPLSPRAGQEKRLDPRKVDRDFAMTSRLRTEGTANLIDGARMVGVRCFVAQSVAFMCEPDPSGGLATEAEPIWGGPRVPAPILFEASRENERRVVEADFSQTLVVRYGVFWGRGTSWDRDGQMIELLRRRRLPIAGGGIGRISLVHVDDAADATAFLLETGTSMGNQRESGRPSDGRGAARSLQALSENSR